MSINIYHDPPQNVWLFGQSVLYTDEPIPREEVPEGWYCYDHKGTSTRPSRLYEMVDQAERNFAGTILSAVPLMRGRTQSKLVQDNFWLTGIPATLADFCAEEGVPCPQRPETRLQAGEEPVEALEPASRGWAMGMA